MAVVKPFKGLRFDTAVAGDISKVVCPPYDIISEEQRIGYINENENNIIRLELPKEGENPYQEANEVLKKWIESGVITREDKDALYIYEEEFTAYGEIKKVKGIVCTVKIEEFSKGVVLPHEFTLSKAKEDRLNLMKATNCNFSQIYSLYMDEEKTTDAKIDALSQGKADFEFTDNDFVTHRMWITKDEEAIASICADFADKKLYIADGHHRYETALNYRNYCKENGLAHDGDGVDYQMMMLVNMEHPGLVVFPTHRIVRDLENFDVQNAVNSCKDYFEVEEKTGTENIEKELDELFNNGKKAFGLYVGDNKWVKLVLKDDEILNTLLPNASKETKELDVTVLHTLILEKLFGIDAENMAKQINLTYVKKFNDAIECVDSKTAQCAFIMNPTKVTQIRDVAANGEKMPQKSTYFYPKLITGLVMNSLS